MLARAAELIAKKEAKAQERLASESLFVAPAPAVSGKRKPADAATGVMGSLRKSARGASDATVTSAALEVSSLASRLPAVTVASPPAVAQLFRRV